ncbi:LOW QUALITY PROTEIN: PI-PLC X domain-containing protein 1-like [Centruroides vittatus]|uniref:LOW QUALITY PROTEIN: PI-PLC X domain-containing protein 1-like n=1 Tax=Centruroides vittatus TaxID=120091 RepID=UPI00350FF8AB
MGVFDDNYLLDKAIVQPSNTSPLSHVYISSINARIENYLYTSLHRSIRLERKERNKKKIMAKMILALFLLLMTDWIGAKTLYNLSLRATADTDCKKIQEDVKIYLSVSSLAWVNNSIITRRQIELNWDVKNPKPKDAVALFDSPPVEHINPLQIVYVANQSTGYYRTKYELPYMNFTKDNITGGCLNYYIAYITDGKITHLNCLKTRPRWMNLNQKYIRNLSLNELMIPGTHDSGSYATFPYDGGIGSITSRFVYAQEERIFNQLAYGIRYFDLRVAHVDNQFMIKHDIIITTNTLEEVLADVLDFVETTKEIVILDFHRHPDYEKIQVELINFIKNKLNPYLIPKREQVEDRRYPEQPLSDFSNFNQAKISDPKLWPSLCQIWPDVQKVEDLKEFFSAFYNRSEVPPFLWSAMAELTPDMTYIFEHVHKGLRVLADDVNRNVTHWFRDKWGKFSNIVATDYFLGNDIIAVAIDINRKKKCESRKPPAEDVSTFSCSPQ